MVYGFRFILVHFRLSRRSSVSPGTGSKRRRSGSQGRSFVRRRHSAGPDLWFLGRTDLRRTHTFKDLLDKYRRLKVSSPTCKRILAKVRFVLSRVFLRGDARER